MQEKIGNDDLLTIWDYLQLHQPLQKSDLILVLGSYDPRVAEYAAELYTRGYAPLMLFSGNRNGLTKEWPKTEAETFADIALQYGVPREAILIENASMNTGENILFSQALLEAQGFEGTHILMVQKPYTERRAVATFKKRWPGMSVSVTSPKISFEDYPFGEVTREMVVRMMLNNFRKILEYPSLGWQIPQRVPEEVMAAYHRLMA